MVDSFKIYPGANLITMVIIGAIVFFIFAVIVYHFRYKKKNQDEWEQADKLFSGIFNQVKESIVVIDENNMIYQANDAFLKYQGKNADKIIGKNIQRIPTDFNFSTDQEELDKAIAEKGSYEKDIKFFHSNGEVIPMHLVFKPISIGDKKGKKKKYIVITATDLKNSTEKDEYIRRQEDELLEIQHLAHLGYWEMNYSTKKVYWSQELYSILGYEEGEVEPNLDIIYWMAYEDDQNRVWKAFLRAFQAQEKVDTHYRIKNNKGEMRDIYLRIRHFFTNDNEHLRTIGILQDITKQVDLRDELNSQVIFADTVLNNGSLLYIACDANFEVVSINDRVSQLVGINSDLAQGKELIDIFGKLNRTHKKFIQENMNFEKPMPMKDFKGNMHYIQWDHATFTKRNNEIVNILLGIDITETIDQRKALEAAFVLEPVTKLPNRRKLMHVLDNYFKKNGQNFDKNLALFFIYIDGIYVVSAGLGQSAEDQLMQSISERLYSAIGKYGLLVRRYAVQFVLFYPFDKNNDKTMEICELITELMKIPYIINGVPIKLDSHIGVSKFPDHAKTKDDLVRFGTGAMNEASRMNVDYYFYDESLETTLAQQLNELKTNNN